MLSHKISLILFAVFWGIIVIVYNYTNFPVADLRNIRLEQTFAFTALSFLYLSVLATPVNYLFKKFRLVQGYKELQRTLVVITFVFGLIHASIAFFFLLGGFNGLGFLNSRFILAITLSFSSLLILLGLVISIYKKINWVMHLLYLVGVLITIHALLLGSHFIILSALIPRVFFIALAVLLLLLTASIDKWLVEKRWMPFFGINIVLVAIGLSFLGYYYFNPKTDLPSTSVHSGHVMTIGNDYQVILNADPSNPKPGEQSTLLIMVHDSKSGQMISEFDLVHESLMHLVIVNDSLEYFNHIHPEKNGPLFSIITSFPEHGQYHLYLTFQPSGAGEQQIPLTFSVGDGVHRPSVQKPDADLTKIVGKYKVSASLAPQLISFEFQDSKSNLPATNLQPYMGAYGHLVMVNQETYQYIHIHPILKDNGSGPKIDFMTAIPLPPGIYRTFGQFKDSNGVFVVDFTIKID